MTVARDLLTTSGSIFVQISDQNEHRVRVLLDEVFGSENFCSCITYRTSVPLAEVAFATGVPVTMTLERRPSGLVVRVWREQEPGTADVSVDMSGDLFDML